MIKNLIIFGTRPEAIKMAPLIREFFKNNDLFETKVCVTAQHRKMLDQVLDFFEITPDYDLDLMKPNQDLYTLTSDIILGLKNILHDFKPDYVFVHGDTTTSMASSVAAFYSGLKVCHVEAGLRTYNKFSPFPEEINRQLTSRIADFHFAPTIQSKQNLLSENISENSIIVTGNTVIDALIQSVEKTQLINSSEIESLKQVIDFSKKIILVTGHRRENHGQGFIDICLALKDIAFRNDCVQIIYPVHLNPNVIDVVFDMLSDVSSISLIDPLSYPSFVWLMNHSYLIITDSGGVQEEAPSLGKPVLVLRETTERPEAVNSGTVLLVGTNKNKIVSVCEELIYNEVKYKEMSSLSNPYGDGNACKKIVNFIKSINI